jgi:hypothetical protein
LFPETLTLNLNAEVLMFFESLRTLEALKELLEIVYVLERTSLELELKGITFQFEETIFEPVLFKTTLKVFQLTFVFTSANILKVAIVSFKIISFKFIFENFKLFEL